MPKPKFKKGQWVVRVEGRPICRDSALIGEIRQVDEASSVYPFVTHIGANGLRDLIIQDEYRLATPEEMENMK